MEEGMAKSEKEKKKREGKREKMEDIRCWYWFGIEFCNCDERAGQEERPGWRIRYTGFHVSPPPQRLYYFAFPLVP
jgi:hypothetical protein